MHGAGLIDETLSLSFSCPNHPSLRHTVDGDGEMKGKGMGEWTMGTV